MLSCQFMMTEAILLCMCYTERHITLSSRLFICPNCTACMRLSTASWKLWSAVDILQITGRHSNPIKKQTKCIFLIYSGWRITGWPNSFSEVSQTKYVVLLPLQWGLNRVFAKRCLFEPSSFLCFSNSPARSSFKDHCPDAPSCWLSQHRVQKHCSTLHFHHASAFAFVPFHLCQCFLTFNLTCYSCLSGF